ncbi:MAG: RsmB/NOP family class I SAM-dependent RNA methyltransferase [Pseudomonadota bacterium]|nr:RsmB/NOP family class I SAM-dependent RNA methyltransferase [Pseudomonadota bacterium]
MTPAARAQAVIELLAMIAATPRPADTLAGSYFRARRYIGSKDRAGISASLYDILRHQARLRWWLQKLLAADTPRTRLLVYELLVRAAPPQQVRELFNGGKFAPALLDGAEARLLRDLEGHTLHHPAIPEPIAVECPEWAVASLKLRFGKDFAAELRALLEAAPLDIRVNTIKATREDILATLQKTAIAAQPCRFSPLGIRLRDRPALTALPMLKEGRVDIQDEGSQLIALAVDARPGHRVVDFCAGAGGKTLALGAQMKNKGRIIACDVMALRLGRSADRFRRAGLHNIELRPLKNENDPWVKKHKSEFDRVLVDAPCSGSGAWRRNPDSRWHSLGPGLDALIKLQAAILESAARLVKPGGRLIYATCSLLPEENEAQVEAFLAANIQFRLVAFDEVWRVTHENNGLACSATPSPGPYLSLTPLRHETDGFFAAVIEKAAEKTAPEKS